MLRYREYGMNRRDPILRISFYFKNQGVRR